VLRWVRENAGGPCAGRAGDREARRPVSVGTGRQGSRTRRRWTRRAWLSTVAIVVCAIAGAGSAPAFADAVWRVDALANPTVAPGATLQYLTQITNVGDTNTDGSAFTLNVTLPPHVTAESVSLPFVPAFFFPFFWSCTAGDGSSPVAGASTIECVSTRIVGAHGSGVGYVPVVTADVDGGAAGTLTAQFQVSGGGAVNTATTVRPVRVSGTPPGFGAAAFDGQVSADAAGDPLTQAGGHPYEVSTSFDFNTVTDPIFGPLWPVEAVKDVNVDLPPGLIGNPSVLAQCTAGELANTEGAGGAKPLCAPASQVGTAMLRLNGRGAPNVLGPVPVYNVVPPPNVAAEFGMTASGIIVTFLAKVRSDGDYGLSVDVSDISEGLGIAGTSVTFWGVPSDPSHDSERACPGVGPPSSVNPSCPSGAPRQAFLRNPTSCTPPGVGLPTTIHIDSWAHPGVFDTKTFFSHLPPGYPDVPENWGAQAGPDHCERVPFDPTFKAAPVGSANASSPWGFAFDLSLPQSDDPDSIGQSDLKTAVVTLPEGVRVSPSSANGLGACSPAQIGLHSADDPSCPDASKVGSVTLDTPLLAKPLTGAIYLATPNDNPFGTLLSIYLVAKGPGVVIKLPGKIEADANTGQLTATFDDNPQLPFSNLHLEFDSGPHAALVTPPTCGPHTTHATLTSWSGKTVDIDSTFTIDHGPNGGPCVPPGFSPGFSAGTLNPVAGDDTSFLLRLTRDDADQELGSVTVDMPSGVTGRIANAVLCPEAAARLGACADVSKVGSVTVGAGAGSDPFYIANGRAYLTGPYKGAPFGLSMVVPAVAGPFDLGTVVVRAAVHVERQSARLRVVSDPIPHILDGIPLDVRDVRVSIDRPHFIVNPTSCAEKHVYGTISSLAGAIAHGSTRFQVGECSDLSLAPTLTLTVGGRHHTGANASTPLTTTLRQTPGQSNLRSVAVTLPSTLNARLAVLNRACTLAAFEAGRCGRAARVGSAVALTPLLRDPLKGSAFFVKNPKRVLPDLMVALRGQVAVDLVGKVGVNPATNQLTTRFDTIPDVAISRFTLRLVAGANGPLGTTTSLCSTRAQRATASIGFRGQNGKALSVRQRLRILGCPRRGRG
jgi:hypothetical protein